MKRPKFDKLYKGEWPYEEYLGVGLSFEGCPTDYKAFLDLLMGESCNPISSRRILNILENGGKKYVTVMARLNFNYIWEELNKLGVKMEITPPYEYEKEGADYISKNSEMDQMVLKKIKDENFEVDFSTIDKDIYEQRLIETKKSLIEKPYNFGRYE